MGGGQPAARGSSQVYVAHESTPSHACLQELLDAVERRTSVLVRPRREHAGLDRVVAGVAARQSGDLLVTDLAGASAVVPGARDGGGTTFAFHTSGSTGSPKCVVYDAEVTRAHAAMVARSLRLGADVAYVAWTPCHFAYGLSVVLSHSVARVPVRFVEAVTSRDAVASVSPDGAPTCLYALPQQVPQLVAAPPVAGLRTLVLAGGRLSGRAAAALAAAYPDLELVNMYGQAEMGPRLATWRGPLATYVEGCIGRPVEGVRLELGEPEDARPGGRTPLLASSPFAMREIWRSPYDAPVVGASADQLVRTGDFALRRDGDLVFSGRSDAVANVAGTRIDLGELAGCVERETGALAVRAATTTSRVSGDELLALQVLPAPGVELTPRQVRVALHPVIGGLAALVDIRIVDSLDLNESGK